MITIYIDNQPHRVKPDQNLLQACLTLGFDLPYFCWHPALHAVGACRQCAVKQFKDEHDTRGKIVMSCMTPVAEGMRISVNDPEARAFRKGIIEYLMLNHPHDCPVCDEGGECHLQDMTMMTGHTYRRNRFRKRTHRNQDLGPFINHEMNRCIQCYRCVRFYRDHAGGRDLNVFGCHDSVYFGRHEDGMLESPFSGNLVEVCPTGVFTDRTLKEHYTRKWDLQTAPAVCVHCGLGCNTIAGERYGSLRRILNRYAPEVNGYFLCDRGRFGYGFVNSEERIKQPMLSPSLAPSPQGRDEHASSPLAGEDRRRGGRPLQSASKGSILAHIASVLSQAKGVIGIGSPRASLESNFALQRFVGPDRFFAGMADRELRLVSLIIDVLRSGTARMPSLAEARLADAVLVLGEDVTNTAPLIALSLRQAVRQEELDLAAKARIPAWHDAGARNAGQGRKRPLYIASPAETPLDDIAAGTWHAAPDEIARLGFAVAHELNADAPAVPGLLSEVQVLAAEIARALKSAKRPLIVAGTSLANEPVIQAAAGVAAALHGTGHDAGLCYTLPECNTMGLGLLGGRNLGEAFTAMADGLADTVIVLENDLYRREDAGTIDAFLDKAKQVIVLDHLANATTERADIVLPAATFAESTGTLVNSEGRAQRSFQVFAPQSDIQAGWKWIDAIMGQPDGRLFDDIVAGLTAAHPVFGQLRDLAPVAGYRLAGQKVPRQPHRSSGRTSMTADLDVNEPKPANDPDSALAYSMEGAEVQPPPPLISRYWSPGWNSVQALNKFQEEIAGPLRGGEAGTRLIAPVPSSGSGAPANFSGIPDAFAPQAGKWLLVPLYRVHGSEELSVHAPGIAKIAADAPLALGTHDAELLGVANGSLVGLSFGKGRHLLRVKVVEGLPQGVAGYPAGAPGLPGSMGPVFGTIIREKTR